MAYEKTTWQSGDIVTSEKLNNIENGVANANNFVVLSLTIDESTGNIPLGKSYNDLMAYYNNNTLVYIKVEIPVSETQTENVMYVLDKLTYEQDF